MSEQQPNKPINYAAFDKSVTPKAGLYIIAASVIIFTIVSIFVASVAGDYQDPNAQSGFVDSLTTLAFVTSLILLFAGVLVYAFQYSKIQKAVLSRFISDNGWQPANNVSRDNIATSLLGVGKDDEISQAFGGTFMGVPFIMMAYKVTSGTGRSSTTYNFLNLHFKLHKKFPLIVLDDKRNNYFNFSDLPSRIPGSKTLQLEGDFDSRFRLTALPETERDVLQVLTPDFMAELLDQPAAANIELQADNLYIIRADPLYTKQYLQNMFAAAQVMLKNIAELSTAWQESSSDETIQAIADTAMAPRAKLLSKRWRISIVSIIMAVFYILMALLFFHK